MNITRKILYNLFKDIAEKHLQIHSFFWGDVPDAFGRQDIIFPLMIVTPNSVSMNLGEVSHSYTVTILDRLIDGDTNKVDVDSDCFQYYRDVVAQLDRLNQVEFGIEFPMTPEPVQDVSPHLCYGFQGEMLINVDENYDQCAVPSEPINFDPTLVCLPASYVVKYTNDVIIEQGTIPSGGSVVVIVPDAPTCLDATWELRDTDGVLIDSGAIPSGGSATIVAPDGVVDVRDTDGNTLYSVSVVSGGSAIQVVGDSSIEVRNSLNAVVDSGVVKAQGSGVFNAPDATFFINSVQVRTAPSNGSASIEVRRNSGSTQVGSLQGQFWRVGNSVVNVNKSDGALISARTVAAEDTATYNVADSVIENSDSSYTANVKATEGLILPDQTIEVNTVNEGSIPSVGTIEIDITDGTNPVTPNDVTIVGRKVTVEVPSGGGSYDLDLVDRFGNAFPTKQVTANATWDLRTLTPFDFADLFLNQLSSPSSTIQTAIIELVADLAAANLWDKFHSIHPLVNGNANDHALNLKYPFKNAYSNLAYFEGSPTHNSNGITTNGSNNGMIIPINPFSYQTSSDQFGMSCYSRTNGASGGGNAISFDMGSTLNGYAQYNALSLRDTSNSHIAALGGSNFVYYNNGGYTGDTLGLFSIVKNGTNGAISRNGTILTGGTAAAISLTAFRRTSAIALGGVFFDSTGILTGRVARNYAYAATMKLFNMTQETDHYTAVQKYQTTLGRNV
jgi:hypothetical protein